MHELGVFKIALSCCIGFLIGAGIGVGVLIVFGKLFIKLVSIGG
jgi:hypothetical protein